MTQNILRKLMLIAVLLTGSNVFAHDFEVDGIYYNITSSTDLTCGVTSGTNEYMGDIVIPTSVYYNSKTYSVTSIDMVAFNYCDGLTNVTIPNSVTSIGAQAFYGCTGLTSVTIHNSVTSIGYQAFYGCGGLTSIVVESGNTKYDSRDNCNAIIETATNTLIKGCKNTIIPNSVTSIDDGAFCNCSGLASVTIPNSVTSIGFQAFYGCTGLTSVTIGNSISSIGGYAFDYCSELTSIVVESGNTKYDSRENCNAIIETATNTLIKGIKTTIIPNSVTSIGYCAFYKCSGLASVTIPNSVTSIGVGAFSCCFDLTNVTIPNSVTSISKEVFCNCSGLTSITIPNSVTSIGDGAFYGCSGLTSITIPNSVTSISKDVFYGCSGLTSITIPNSVTSIGDGAFYGCSGLTSITIPNSVTSIGNGAFVGCSNLTEIICKSTTPPTIYSLPFYNVPRTATLYVPVGSREAYANDGFWCWFTNIVEIEFENETGTIITIMDATNQGSVSFSYEEGKAFDFTVTPVTGYIVNTVLVNGEICEAEDGVYNIESVRGKTTISVSYELDPATSVNTLSTNNIKVYGCDNTLTVTGVEFGDTISVYDRNGTMLKTQNSVGSTNYISLDNGIYIVKVNDKSFKVML